MHCLSQHILKSFQNTFYTHITYNIHLQTYSHIQFQSVVHIAIAHWSSNQTEPNQTENIYVNRTKWNGMKQDDRIHARRTTISLFIYALKRAYCLKQVSKSGLNVVVEKPFQHSKYYIFIRADLSFASY